MKRSRMLWVILFGLPVLVVLPVALLGSSLGHGGDIEFDSRPGRTEFRVSLPLPGPASPQAAAQGDV